MNRADVKFAVAGTGNAACALAGDIGLKGYSVKLGALPEHEARLSAVLEDGGINITGVASRGFVKPSYVTSIPEEIVSGADIIFIAVPAYHVEAYIKAVMPYLSDGQFVVFISNFGALRFKKWLTLAGIEKDIVPVESLSLVYATRIIFPKEVKVLAVKKQMPVSCLPAARTEEFIDMISGVFPQFIPAENVLFTSLNNPGPVIHPALMLCNAGRIEATRGRGWNLYADGATEAVVRIMLEIEKERHRVLERLGVSGIKISFRSS